MAQPPQGGGRGGDGPRMSAEDRQKMMQEQQQKRDADLREKLQLSDVAAAKVDSINAKYDKQLRELMSPEKRSGDREAMRTQMENIQKARAVEVKMQLTEEQGKEYDKWLKEQQKNRRQGGRDGGGPRGNR